MSDPIVIVPMAVAPIDLVVEEQAVTAAGATLTALPPASRWSLRARTPEKLAEVLGQPVPARIGEAEGGIACIGPDEWFADLPAGTSLPLGAGEPVSVVDVSSRGVAFQLEGEKAAWVISAGCALDIANFAVGRVTRTMFETAEIILWRTGETSFRVFAWRSFGPWLWNALKAVEA